MKNPLLRDGRFCWRVLKTVAAQCVRQLQATLLSSVTDSFWFSFSFVSFARFGSAKSSTHPFRQIVRQSERASFTRKVIHFVPDLKFILQLHLTSSYNFNSHNFSSSFTLTVCFANWFYIHIPLCPASCCRYCRLLQLLASPSSHKSARRHFVLFIKIKMHIFCFASHSQYRNRINAILLLLDHLFESTICHSNFHFTSFFNFYIVVSKYKSIGIPVG